MFGHAVTGIIVGKKDYGAAVKQKPTAPTNKFDAVGGMGVEFTTVSDNPTYNLFVKDANGRTHTVYAEPMDYNNVEIGDPWPRTLKA
jgi:hypothetical protein